MRLPPAFPAQHTSPFSRCRTQGRELSNTGPHTRAGSSPCVGCVFLKSGSLCAYPVGAAHDPEQSSWARPWCRRSAPGQWAWSIVSTARPALVRVFHRVVGVVGCVHVDRVHSAPGPGEGVPQGVDARCRHREGVVDIVRGLSTPRGGYNARSCQQRASAAAPWALVGTTAGWGAPRRAPPKKTSGRKIRTVSAPSAWR